MNRREFEQTLVLIKPDALRNSLTGYILSQLSEYHSGLRFAATKVIEVSELLAKEHYAEHKGKKFFPALLSYIMGREHYPPEETWKRRVIAIVFQGPDAVRRIRSIVGPTNPHVARQEKPGSIRALGTVVEIKDKNGAVLGQRMDNLIHASATDEEAEREIKLWFRPTDIPPLMRAYATEESKEHYYVRNGRLATTYSPGSFCVLAPGDVGWATDIQALHQIEKRELSSVTLEAVIAKYLMNDRRELTPDRSPRKTKWLWKTASLVGSGVRRLLEMPK